MIADAFGTRIEDLAWIDDFTARIRDYVRVREEDGVLIKVPTEAYPLNPRGVDLLRRALAGETAARIAETSGAAGHPDRIHAIHVFFCDVRDLLAGRLGEARGRRATRVTRFTEGFTRLPVLSEVALTYRCNLACSFCYAGCGTDGATPGNPGRERRRPRLFRREPARDPVRDEMTTAEVRRVLDAIADEGEVPSVSFTGGEATLRRDLPELIGYAREKDLRVNLITNGVRCGSRRYARDLAAAGLQSAQVSIEGPGEDVHDALAGRRGAFARSIRGVANLAEAGVRVHTHTTISRENAAHLEGIVDLAARLGRRRLSMNQLIPTGTPALGGRSRLLVTYSEIGPLVLGVKRAAEALGLDFHWYSPTPFCIFNPIAHGLGNKGCAACDGLLHVSPSGEVLPCSSFSGGVGNLLEAGFRKVWFGADARWYREKRMLPRICRGCEHRALCQGACTLYFSGVGEAELRNATKRRWHAPARS